MPVKPTRLPAVLKTHGEDLLRDWIALQMTALGGRSGAADERALRANSHDFLTALTQALQSDGSEDLKSPSWAPVRELLNSISASRAKEGFTPAQTATFVFSLKEPIFNRLRAEVKDGQALTDEIWSTTLVLDKLGIYTMEAYQRSREDVISRQQQELLELSTPVVQLWDKILALPLIGTLDSNRTQVVMQNLLEAIVATRSDIAIIDITGVPTVDTLVAQHLLKTIAAARLMGADCIVSGIRPQIAQTIIHLGVDLGAVITKATMADAFQVAMERMGLSIARAAAE